jgi:hypothetical protein
MANVAPEDVSGPVPQFPFMTEVVSRISEANGWPRGPQALPDAEPESENHPLSGEAARGRKPRAVVPGERRPVRYPVGRSRAAIV